MNIALLTDGIYPNVIGGMQKHSYYLVKYLAGIGVKLTLYHCVPGAEKIIVNLEGFSERELINIRHKCFHFPAPGLFPGHYLRESYKYSELIFKEIENEINEFDFIYVKGFSGWKLIEEKKKGFRTPPIGVKFHGLNMFQKTASFKAYLEALMFRGPVLYNMKNADYNFSYGGKITDIIRSKGIDSNRILEFPTGINQSWLNEKIPENKILKFLYVGRYERLKGIEELCSVIQDISGSYDFEFHFVGPIPEKLKIPDPKVKYWGKIMDEESIKSIYCQCDVLLCPSYSEGMPNVILEAMAHSMTVIATDVGAVNTLVNEKTGWLINKCDKQLIRAAMINAINSKGKILNSKKLSSYKLIRENFDWKKIAKEILEKLNSLN